MQVFFFMTTVRGNFPIPIHFKKFLIVAATINAFKRNVNKTIQKKEQDVKAIG